MNKYIALLNDIEDLLADQREQGNITELEEMRLIEVNYRAIQMIKRGREITESRERIQA